MMIEDRLPQRTGVSDARSTHGLQIAEVRSAFPLDPSQEPKGGNGTRCAQVSNGFRNME